MIFEKKIKKWGGSIAIIIPQDLAEYIGFFEDQKIMIKEDKGKYGKFISIWRKDQKEVENE